MTQNVLTTEVAVRVSDFDGGRFFKPSGVLAVFQEAADLHAKQLGVDIETLLTYGKSWVIARLKYECEVFPYLFNAVTVTTWPVSKGVLECDRDFVFADGNGKEFLRGSAKYCMIDIATKKVETLKALRNYPEICETRRTFSEKFQKAQTFEPKTPAVFRYYAGNSDTDVNGHMNNVRYADLAYNAVDLNGALKVSAFNISYLSEICAGDETELFSEKFGEKLLVVGKTRGKNCFAAEMLLDK